MIVDFDRFVCSRMGGAAMSARGMGLDGWTRISGKPQFYGGDPARYFRKSRYSLIPDDCYDRMSNNNQTIWRHAVPLDR
ncbi:MAG: hypothetical protein DSY89_10165 [Deltaproteobacteria bacterium]|nr:MAG: hypothetical protein DSY89_10165 [Deltaproteobacteria bacterium]